jgi:hypothetical protein
VSEIYISADTFGLFTSENRCQCVETALLNHVRAHDVSAPIDIRIDDGTTKKHRPWIRYKAPAHKSNGAVVVFRSVRSRASIWPFRSKPVNDNARYFSELVNTLGRLAPRRQILISAEYASTRIALNAFRYIRPNTVSRVFLFRGQEYITRALFALKTKAARHVNFYNFTPEIQTLPSLLAQKFGPKCGPSDSFIQNGMHFNFKNWVDIIETPSDLFVWLEDLSFQCSSPDFEETDITELRPKRVNDDPENDREVA